MSSAVLVYKARGYNKRTDGNRTVKNRRHVEYIATRPGAWKEAGEESALFGVINNQYKNVISVEEGAARVGMASDRYKTVYRQMISFTSGQAAHLGLNKLEDWKKYVKEQVLVIAKQQGIKFEDLEWQAAIHNKKGQPHAHIVLWDNSNNIQPNAFPKELYNSTRRKLIQSTYKEEFAEFYKSQDIAAKNLRADSKEVLEAFADFLTPQKLMRSDAERYINGDIVFDVSGVSNASILNSSNADKILSEYLKLRLKVLEYKGALKYKFLPNELKNDFKAYIKLLLESNGQLSKLADDYVRSYTDVFKFYSAKDPELSYQAGKYTNKAIEMISNALLQDMKDYQFEDIEDDTYARDLYISGSILSAFSSLAHLTRINKAQNAHKQANFGDLSKDAKKEIVKDLKDRGLEM